MRIDASSWKFVLLRYPDGDYEIVLASRSLPELNDEERWHAATIVLESILGEEELMNLKGSYDLVDELEPQHANRARPIQELWEAFVGPSSMV